MAISIKLITKNLVLVKKYIDEIKFFSNSKSYFLFINFDSISNINILAITISNNF